MDDDHDKRSMYHVFRGQNPADNTYSPPFVRPFSNNLHSFSCLLVGVEVVHRTIVVVVVVDVDVGISSVANVADVEVEVEDMAEEINVGRSPMAKSEADGML